MKKMKDQREKQKKKGSKNCHKETAENKRMERQTWSLRVFVEYMEMYGGDKR